MLFFSSHFQFNIFGAVQRSSKFSENNLFLINLFLISLVTLLTFASLQRSRERRFEQNRKNDGDLRLFEWYDILCCIANISFDSWNWPCNKRVNIHFSFRFRHMEDKNMEYTICNIMISTQSLGWGSKNKINEWKWMAVKSIFGENFYYYLY